jgi:UDPglucose--hexose-1-phosphate uridylyltransferase
MDTPPIVAEYRRESEQPWQVCVVPNLYPVLDDVSLGVEFSQQVNLFQSKAAHGLHEVVIESPSHVTRTSDLTLDQTVFMLRAYRDRMRVMRDSNQIAYAQVMKNSGADAGASLKHTHSQIFGMPFVPEQVQQELNGAKTYFDKEKHCVFCRIIQAELELQSRVLYATDDLLAWCPHASRFGYETWISPRNHAARFEDSSDRLLAKLGSLFQLVLRKIEQHPRIDAFNYLLHSLPFDSNRSDQYHWHIEIIPRIAKAAGFEWGTRVHINTVAPERAAEELRIDL